MTVTEENYWGTAVFAFSPYNRIFTDLETAKPLITLKHNSFYEVFYKNYRYPVFAVSGCSQPPLTLTQQYGGVLLDGDPLYADYLDERIGKLQKAIDGLRRSHTTENAVKADALSEICQALREKRETL